MSDAQKIQYLTNAANNEKRRADTAEAKITSLTNEHRSFLRRIGFQLGATSYNEAGLEQAVRQLLAGDLSGLKR